MIDDIILAKLAVIRRCLQRIQQKTGGDPETVDDIDIQDIVVLNLQRAIQATIDLAAHLITIHQSGLPAGHDHHFGQKKPGLRFASFAPSRLHRLWPKR